MFCREEALNLVKKHLIKENHRKHVLAVEAIMKKLANHFKQDYELWGLVGLLHDLDYEQTEEDFSNHSKITAELLRNKIPQEGIDAILSHNFEYTGNEPKTILDFSLISSDAASGFIIAATLVIPSKRLVDVKIKSLMKKFKDKNFAKGTGRDRMLLIEKTGLELTEFFDIALKGMQDAAKDLGL